MSGSCGPRRVLLVDAQRQLAQRARPLFASGQLTQVGSGTTPPRMLQTVLETAPNVVLIDLGGDGALEAIEAVMAERPTPILALHRDAGKGSDPFRALALGALDLALLPAEADDAFWRELSRRIALLSQVRVVQHVRGKRRHRERPAANVVRQGEPPFPLVAIAASLGGPRALAHLLAALPPSLAAPVCVCQHISDGFTRGLATWLSSEAGRRVIEARDDLPLEPGTVYVAPSGAHFRVKLPGRAALDDGPPIEGFRPSCDALLESVARSFGRRAVGVVLTGMGRDGAYGLRAIRDAGGRTAAQDEGSCVVFGMPREAILLGAAEEVLPLEGIARAVARWVEEC